MGKFRMRALVLAVVVLAGASCGMLRDRAKVRDGLLVSGLDRDAFLAEWGPPTRTSTLTGDDTTQAGWGGGGGFFFRGKEIYDVWEYSRHGVTLVFYRARLVTWKTEKTVAELKGLSR